MRDYVPELLFPSRKDFHIWLRENAAASDGVWLVFSKSKDITTISAAEALEEALCFGWIDGQMKSIDSTKYIKYFARRRPKSRWSEKNKGIIEKLRQKKMMNKLGEQAVKTAMENGSWDMPGIEPVTAEEVETFTKKLKGISPAYENFTKMPPSVKLAYTGRYLSFRTEEFREKDFLKIIDRLNKNLKPM